MRWWGSGIQRRQEEAARLIPEMEAQSTREGDLWSATDTASAPAVLKKTLGSRVFIPKSQHRSR